jgi:hypothetical protein
VGQHHVGSGLAVPPSATLLCTGQAFWEKLSIEPVTDLITKKRLAFHIGGYDLSPPVIVHERFLRELGRFERIWPVTASVSGITVEADRAMWNVVTSRPNWQVETECRLVRWDDVMAECGCRPRGSGSRSASWRSRTWSWVVHFGVMVAPAYATPSFSFIRM